MSIWFLQQRVCLLQRKKENYPSQRRARTQPWFAIDPQDQFKLDLESNLILRVIVLILLNHFCGGVMDYGLEHPEDPEKIPQRKRAFLSEQEA